MSEKVISKWHNFEGIEYTLVRMDGASFRVRTDSHPGAEYYELCARLEFLEKALADVNVRRVGSPLPEERKP